MFILERMIGMTKLKRIAVYTFIVFLLASACSLDIYLPFGNQTYESGALLFQDDFSDQKSGWDTWYEEGSMIAYQEGGLRFFVDQPNYDYFSSPGKLYKDVKIDVDATHLAGPEDNDFGVICRFKDDNNFYAFLIGSDGFSGILKVINGNYLMISGDGMQYSPSIISGRNVNHITVLCNGSNLVFWVNGEQLFDVQDFDLDNGDIGLIAGTRDAPGVDVFFDNFVVFMP